MRVRISSGRFSGGSSVRLGFVTLLVLSATVGCSTRTTSVIPKECPEVPPVVLLETADMTMKGLYPNTRDYLYDQAWPYCEYIHGLRNDPE